MCNCPGTVAFWFVCVVGGGEGHQCFLEKFSTHTAAHRLYTHHHHHHHEVASVNRVRVWGCPAILMLFPPLCVFSLAYYQTIGEFFQFHWVHESSDPPLYTFPQTSHVSTHPPPLSPHSHSWLFYQLLTV